MPRDDLSPAQGAMVETWERHTAAEFETKSIDATMATMTAEPVPNSPCRWLPGIRDSRFGMLCLADNGSPIWSCRSCP